MGERESCSSIHTSPGTTLNPWVKEEVFKSQHLTSDHSKSMGERGSIQVSTPGDHSKSMGERESVQVSTPGDHSKSRGERESVQVSTPHRGSL